MGDPGTTPTVGSIMDQDGDKSDFAVLYCSHIGSTPTHCPILMKVLVLYILRVIPLLV